MVVMNLYKCPICSQVLRLTERAWKCSNNHCFDVAKEGYVNLLPVNKKRSKEPGDSKAMLQSRRRFLEQGHYQRLAEAISQLLLPNLQTACNLLDLGCGEGYYLEQINKSLHISGSLVFKLFALDIAKPGVQMTAKRLKRAGYEVECSVASAVDTPYTDQSFDAIYSVFAPFSDVEINRILKPDGRFILVGPGSTHLTELSQVVYDKVQPHEGNTKSIANSEFLKLARQYSVQYRVDIVSEYIPDLLAMTPYFWSISAVQKQKLFAMPSLEVTLDFSLQEYVRKTDK